MTHASHYTETFECTEREEQECGSLSKYSEGHWGGPRPLLQRDFFRPQEDRGAGESDPIVPGLDNRAREVLGTGGPLHAWANTLKRHQTQMGGRGKGAGKKEKKGKQDFYGKSIQI